MCANQRMKLQNNPSLTSVWKRVLLLRRMRICLININTTSHSIY